MIADELKDENRALARREARMEQFKNDMASARPVKEYAWEAIRGGADPTYVAMRYGFTVEEMQRAKQVHEAREAARSGSGNES